MDVCSAARGLMEAPKWDAGFPRTSSICEQIKMLLRKLVHRKVQCFKTLLYCRGTLRCQAARKILLFKATCELRAALSLQG